MVTRREVAIKAGVSVAVVSYVMNNKDNVKESTRRKVLAAMEELGYQPNLTARSLKTKKSHQIAVLVNNLGNSFEAGILLRLEPAARKKGYFTFFQTYSDVSEKDLKSLFMGRVDGIILLGQSLTRETCDHFTSLRIPLVSVTRPLLSKESIPYIDVDWHQAFGTLIRHVKQRGHQRIGFMSAQHDLHHYTYRFQAFQEAMADEGLNFDPGCLLTGEGRFENASNAMRKALKQPLPFTALICANDLMALGVLDACRKANLSVPRDLAVTGCEDILMSSQTSPPLTVLHYPRELAGEAAIEMLLQQLEGHPCPNRLLPSQILVRESTG